MKIASRTFSQLPLALCSFTLAGLSALPAAGQILPKPPSAPEPVKEYVPPPAPPPRPVTPPEPEVNVPDLTIKGADGKIPRREAPVELFVLQLLNIQDPLKKPVIENSLRQRRAEIDAKAMEHLPDVLKAKRLLPTLADGVDMGKFEEMRQLAEKLASENPADRLLKDGGITPGARNTIARSVQRYEEALAQEQSEATGADVNKIMTAIAQRLFTDRTQEARNAIDRRIAAVAAAGKIDPAPLSLTPEQREKFDALVSELGKASGEADKTAIVDRLVLDVLNADQARTLLQSAQVK